MEDVFLSAYEYSMILAVPILLFTVAALSDEIIFLVKRAVITRVQRNRRR